MTAMQNFKPGVLVGYFIILVFVFAVLFSSGLLTPLLK